MSITQIPPAPPLATANAPGAMPAASAAQSIDIKCDGDITTTLLAAIAALHAADGGTIRLSPGNGYCTSQVVIPDDGVAFVAGTSAPLQKSIRITGAGAGDVGDRLLAQNWTPPLGGTILDLRYASGPKIVATGSGRFEIDHLSLKDTTDGTQDFIHIGLTTLKCHDVVFYGKTAATPVQDAIVLGSPITFIGFQTVIQDCQFSRIRRGVYGKMYCNSTVISRNTWACGCGGEAAIELDGTGGFCDGNTIADNLIEMSNGTTLGTGFYVYGVKCTNNVKQNYFSNMFYDPSLANALSAYYFDATSSENLIIDCMSTGLTVQTGAGVGGNTVISSNTGNMSFAKLFKALLGMDGFLNYTGSGSGTQESIKHQYQTGANSATYGLGMSATKVYLQARKTGSGTALPLEIWNDTGMVARFAQDGSVTIPALAGTGSRNVMADATGKITAP